jgi:hypothetical protein
LLAIQTNFSPRGKLSKRVNKNVSTPSTASYELQVTCESGWEAMLEVRGSPMGGVLQEAQLGQKRSYDLKIRILEGPPRV